MSGAELNVPSTQSARHVSNRVTSRLPRCRVQVEIQGARRQHAGHGRLTRRHTQSSSHYASSPRLSTHVGTCGMSGCRPVSSYSLFPLHVCGRGFSPLPKERFGVWKYRGNRRFGEPLCFRKRGSQPLFREPKNNGDKRLHSIQSRQTRGKTCKVLRQPSYLGRPQSRRI